jgi:hypothetical protein
MNVFEVSLACSIIKLPFSEFFSKILIP